MIRFVFIGARKTQGCFDTKSEKYFSDAFFVADRRM